MITSTSTWPLFNSPTLSKSPFQMNKIAKIKFNKIFIWNNHHNSSICQCDFEWTTVYICKFGASNILLINCFHHLDWYQFYAIMPPFIPSHALINSILHLVCNRLRLNITHPVLKRFASLIIDRVCQIARWWQRQCNVHAYLLLDWMYICKLAHLFF